LCGADSSVLQLRDGDYLVVRGVSAVDASVIDYVRQNPVRIDDQSYVGRAVLHGSIANIPDFERDTSSRLRNYHEKMGFKALLIVPLMTEGGCVGAFALTRNTVGVFSQRQVELVQTFTDQAVIAIENVRLFEEVQARTRELADSLENLRAAQDRLVQSEKMASLGQLTAGIAHEIKNPLNFINNFAGLSAELLGELKELVAAVATGVDAATRADIEDVVATLDTNLGKIGEHGKRADGIVKSMLLHSRGGSGQVQKTDLNALIEEALALTYHGLRAQDQSFNITMERDFDTAVGAIDAVSQDLTRVFLNLIGNGFYAASKRKRDGGDGQFSPLLKVTTRSLGDRIEVRVRDNGVGIADEVRAKLFTPFFTTKPTGEGTGLGLSISYEIVTRGHGGSVDVESRVGEFTEFIVRLPRTMRRSADTETRGPRV
jgi:signal transduction histidine kinase